MIEICKNVFIASQNEDLNGMRGIDSLCLCAKTFHQRVVGYKGNLDKLHAEYLIAERQDENLIAFNLIDAPKVEYIPKVIIDKALEFVEKELDKGEKVVVVCNQGRSRSACIGLMHMLKTKKIKGCKDFAEVEEKYKRIYPMYDPSLGMRTYAENFFWEMKDKGEY